MRNTFSVLLIGLFLAFTIYGQELKTASFAPEKPKIGDKIEVTYNADAKGALLKDAGEILLCVNALQPNGMPTITEIKLTKNGNTWKGIYNFNDSLATVLLFRFDSDKEMDDNNGNTWFTMVYNDKGDAIEKAHYTMGMLYSRGGYMGFRLITDKDKSKLESETETKLYPPKANAAGNEMNKLYGEYAANKDKKEVVERIVKDILAYIEKNKATESSVAGAISLLNYMKQKETVENVAEEFLKTNPTGPVATQYRQSKVFNDKDKGKQIEIAQKYLNEIKNLPENESSLYNSVVFSNLIDLKRYDEAYNFLLKSPKPSGSQYNNLSWPLIEKGEQLEKAVEWAKKGVELCRKFDLANKSKYYTTKDYIRSCEVSLAFVLDTYGFGLEKLGKLEEAEKNYAEAISLGMKELGAEAHTRYINCLNKNGKFDKAASFGDDCIKAGFADDKIIEAYKTAYLKSNKGSKEQIEKIIADLNAKTKKEAAEKMAKELVNKPAPQFELKDLDGKTVKLADLKGKVVVVDFWATWCGPCLASFPSLQKVYEKYKDNPDIVILAVNTWENETGAEREKNVKNFMKENKYTFKVLFDVEDRAKAFVTQYGVDGIPTKFIIDKDGNIQFKTVGFGGAAEMVTEMDAQFELLLKEGHKALLKK